MKKSIKHLSLKRQKQINFVVDLIHLHLKEHCMIILFGSYARGNYVTMDCSTESWGQERIYQSDYDFLVVTSSRALSIVERKLEKVEKEYEKVLGYNLHAPLDIIVENLDDLNRKLEVNQYFFTDIIKEGIMLYDSGEYKLAKPKKLDFKDIKEISTDYYKRFYDYGCDFLETGRRCVESEKYVYGTFELHQACERFLKSISLVHTNYCPQYHKLDKLRKRIKRFSPELFLLFNLYDSFERRCFKLLCDAYVDGRYNPNYEVTKEEYEFLLEKVEKIREITGKNCLEKITSYDELIKKEK